MTKKHPEHPPKDPLDSKDKNGGGYLGGGGKNGGGNGGSGSENGRGNGSGGDNGPPIRVIILAAIGMTVLSSFGGAENFLEEISTQLLESDTRPRSLADRRVSIDNRTDFEKNQSSSNRSNSDRENINISEKPFRLDLAKECIQTNSLNLADVPTVSDLLESLSWQEEQDSEFERQLKFLFVNSSELQDAIKDCDLTLFQQIFAVTEGESTIVVTGEVVNVRADPRADSEILARVRYGTVLEVDKETEYNLPLTERLAIEQDNGWQPIFLQDRKRGYIFSLYIE